MSSRRRLYSISRWFAIGVAALLLLIPCLGWGQGGASSQAQLIDPSQPYWLQWKSMYPDRVAAILRTADEVIAHGPFQANWVSLDHYQIPKWYLDAKLGIFIHWGVYSVPAFGSEWYPREMYLQGSATFKHHVATYGPQNKFGYKNFIPMFKAEKFDPMAWAKLFKAAGAKYVVPVAEHHDGFAMYDSDLTTWCAAKMGPKRDIIGELAQAVRKEGLIFGLSTHREEHWWFYNGGMQFDSDVRDPKYYSLYGPAAPENVPPTKAFLDDWLARDCELVDKYHPQIVWFDWWINTPAFRPYLQRFAAYYYDRAAQWHKGVVINYKYAAFPPQAAVLDLERGEMEGIRPRFWQTDTSISNNSWGYVTQQDFKTPEQVVHELVDIVSKNGCLLLNIGPKSDGTIPQEEVDVLLNMGKWLKINGEAIYGTRPWVIYGEGPTRVKGGAFSDTSHSAYTPEDIRFTTKGNTLYAIVMAWPQDGVVRIRSLGTDARFATGSVRSIQLLGSSARLHWEQTSDALVVQLPSQKPCDYAYTLKITGLRPAPQLPITANGLRLDAEHAQLHGNQIQIENSYGESDIGYWDDPADWVSWKVHLPAGVYRLEARVSAVAPSAITLQIGDKRFTLAVPATGGWGDAKEMPVGTLTVAHTGDYELTVRAADAAHWKAVNLFEVRLVPEKGAS
jgi:alpha-L-fucosidase